MPRAPYTTLSTLPAMDGHEKHWRMQPFRFASPEALPQEPELRNSSRTSTRTYLQRRVLFGSLAAITVYALSFSFLNASRNGFQDVRARTQQAPYAAPEILAKCARIQATPGPSSDFWSRSSSDRFEPGTRPTLIKNVTLWTGARNGTEIVYGDVYLDKGLVLGIGYIPEALYVGRDTEVVDAHGGWVTPGLGEHAAFHAGTTD